MSESINNLPKDILAKRIEPFYESAWLTEDVSIVLKFAEEADLAFVGGQAQFRPIINNDDGRYILDLYWISFSPKDRYEKEPWDLYVSRSHKEGLELFQKILENVDFQQEATYWLKRHPKLGSTKSILESLCFILDFTKSGDIIPIIEAE